ncbi:MAG: hypothetical protein RIC55_26180 [Pirellulaceae bacterium]
MHAFARLIALTLILIPLLPLGAQQQENPPEEASLRRWADELDDESYGVRESATRRLAQAGAAAVPFLHRAGESDSLESIVRSVHILSRMIAGSDEEAKRQAVDALAELAASSDRRTADRAREAIIQRQARHVAQLERLGARAYWQSGTVVKIYCSNSKIEDDDLALLRHFPDLVTLSLNGANITDAGMKHVTCLRKLERLDLFHTQVGDAGLEHLATMKSLKWLPMGQTKVTDAGLAHLRSLTQLEYLGLRGDDITDKGLAHLGPLTNLTGLYLGETKVTDAGLHHIAHLRQMDYLRLHTLRVSDAGLVHLRGMKNLTRIDAYDTDITDKGVKQLQEWFPSCQIVTKK